MAIEAKFDIKDLVKDMEEGIDQQLDIVADALSLACTQCVIDARLLPSLDANSRKEPHQPHYIDDTGNLRSSIGFSLFRDGKKVGEDFEVQNGIGSIGMERGIMLSEDVGKEFSTSARMLAVVVAGMDYAADVESKGYDVLSTCMLDFHKYFKDYLKAGMDGLK